MERTIIGVYIVNTSEFRHYAGPFTNEEFEEWKVWMKKIFNTTWNIRFEFVQLDRGSTDAFFTQRES